MAQSGPYVTIEQLAKHLQVSISTIRGWVRNKHIPEDTYIRVVNTYRFCIDDVTAALSAGSKEIETVNEVDEDL
tara:strand:- start:246 stop:467 length:222 start_codon:yes stop_codon:yes gene_type:complete